MYTVKATLMLCTLVYLIFVLHERRELLDQVKRWEESELKDAQVDRPPAYLTKGPGPLAKKSLAPINYSNPSVGAAPSVTPGNNNSSTHPGLELLNSKISDLTDENQQLKEKLKQLETAATAEPTASKEMPSPSPPPPAPIVTDQTEKSNQEIEELTQAFK